MVEKVINSSLVLLRKVIAIRQESALKSASSHILKTLEAILPILNTFTSLANVMTKKQ